MSKNAMVRIEDPSGAKPEECCRWLEEGSVLYFPETPFEFPEEDRRYLLAQRQSGGQLHKNIAYKPLQDKVTGSAGLSPGDRDRMRRVLGGYSRRAIDFLSRFLAPYASRWRLDYASFRPFQERGRELRLRARNDLLHVDNFPTRPTDGDGILRFFTNINPREPRQWIVTGPFESLARRFGGGRGLPWPRPLEGWRHGRHSLARAARGLGLPLAARSPYDEFMLGLHHAMKEDSDFQSSVERESLEFPSGASWMVFTDRVAHAALSGQYALEQTLLVCRDSMIAPEISPLSVVERLSGRRPLTRPAQRRSRPTP